MTILTLLYYHFFCAFNPGYVKILHSCEKSLILHVCFSYSCNDYEVLVFAKTRPTEEQLEAMIQHAQISTCVTQLYYVDQAGKLTGTTIKCSCRFESTTNNFMHLVVSRKQRRREIRYLLLKPC